MPGSEMTVSVTVANKGLGTAENVSVTASGVGNGGQATIPSILPGRSATVELTVAVPDDFSQSTKMSVTATAGASDDTAYADADINYGPYFQVKSMPDMTSLPGTSDYRTQTVVYNAGNAPGVPTLKYQVSLFASDEPATEYSYTATTTVAGAQTGAGVSSTTASQTVAPGGAAVLTYVLEDTPVTQDTTGTLTVMVDTGDADLGAYQYIQGQMPKLKTLITKSDLQPDDESQDTPVVPAPPKPSDGGSSDSETQEPSFADIPSGSWYEEAVSWAVKSGITTGMGSGLFSPDLACTRAQAVTFLWRASGSPSPQNTVSPFTDVPADAWYRDAMLWAVEQGITKGTGDGTTFSPDLVCTRAQIVTFLYRLEQAGGGGFNGAWAIRLPFTDTPDWAYESIAWCYMKGITAGTGNDLFSPDLACTRAQIVTLLYRYSQLTIDN